MRSGQISVPVVEDDALVRNWSLSVSDDGIGMPENPDDAKAGLGTNIVEALAKQLDAEVSIGNERPGTMVSITHRHLTIAEDVLENAEQPMRVSRP